MQGMASQWAKTGGGLGPETARTWGVVQHRGRRCLPSWAVLSSAVLSLSYL